MPTATKKCTGCKKRFKHDHDWISRGLIRFHSAECLIEWDRAKKKTEYMRNIAKTYLGKGAPKKRAKTRTQHFQDLQRLVNQYILSVRDAGKPCFTCGTDNPNIKYDAGHYIHAGRGGGDRRRFIHMNIHKQCSQQCNVHGSGMKAEYRQKIIDVYGQDQLDWLEGENNHPTLKEQFPTTQAILDKIDEYRRIIRSAGLKPNY